MSVRSAKFSWANSCREAWKSIRSLVDVEWEVGWTGVAWGEVRDYAGGGVIQSKSPNRIQLKLQIGPARCGELRGPLRGKLELFGQSGTWGSRPKASALLWPIDLEST